MPELLAALAGTVALDKGDYQHTQPGFFGHLDKYACTSASPAYHHHCSQNDRAARCTHARIGIRVRIHSWVEG